jgi:uridine phosphorylase
MHFIRNSLECYAMKKIAESELIINARGAVYHLNLRPEELATTIVTVGDPDRVGEVSKYFDRIESKHQHREFITHTGYIGQKRLSVVSTGIGPDNIDIVLNELDALANIDFNTRQVKSQHQKLNLIRLGTSGALQAQIPVDSFVVSTHGLGIDNLMLFYRHENNPEEIEILNAFEQHTHVQQAGIQPYLFGASSALLKHFVQGFSHGITVTCPGFYGPQGRVLRGALSLPDLIEQLPSFRYGNHHITNFEMETSSLFGLGRILQHNCLSISAIVANRVSQTFSHDGAKAVENLLQTCLPIIADLA